MFLSKSAKKIQQSIYLYPILLVLITFIVILFVVSNFLKELEAEEKDVLKSNLLIKEKEISLNQIKQIISCIDNEIIDVKDNIKDTLQIKTKYIENILNNNLNKSTYRIKNIVYNILNNTNEENIQYFIYNKKTNLIIFNNITNNKTIKFYNDLIKNKKEFYFNSNDTNNEILEKNTYIKYIPKFNWLVVTRISNNKINNRIKEKILNRIKKKTYSNNNYFWLYNKKYELLSNSYNKNKLSTKEDKKIIKKLINKALEKKEATIMTYSSINKDTNISENKMSYVYYIAQWDWILGTNIKLDNANTLFKEQKELIHSKIDKIYEKILLIFALLLIISIYISTLLSKITKNQFIKYSELLKLKNNTLEKKVLVRTKELHDLNKNLKEKINIEIEKNRTYELTLLEKSKFIQISEMLENIAHQWRQPLNVISVIASGMLLKFEMNIMNKDYTTPRKTNNFL